jgi:hypothetical protein
VQDQTDQAGGQPGVNRLESKAAPADDLRIVESGTAYTAAQLSDQVSSRLARGENVGVTEIASAQLSGCVDYVTRGKAPLLVDRASYEGHDAVLVVLPGSSPQRLDVWIVGPACSASNPTLVRHTQTVIKSR